MTDTQKLREYACGGSEFNKTILEAADELDRLRTIADADKASADPCIGCQYEKEEPNFKLCVDCELSDYSLRSPITGPIWKREPLIGRCRRCGFEEIQPQADACKVPPGYVLAPVESLQKWRNAFAEELSAWDIDPPLHHVQTSHDEISAMLSAAPTQERTDISHQGAHMAHCFQGEYQGSCKYGDGDACPAAPTQE